MNQREKARMKKALKRADHFNAKVPVGTAVRYFSLVDEAEFFETKTRTPAWAMPCGEAVVSIEGRAGGFSLDHIRLTAYEAGRLAFRDGCHRVLCNAESEEERQDWYRGWDDAAGFKEQAVTVQ